MKNEGLKTTAYIVEWFGGYYSGDEGRVRHPESAQLFATPEIAQEQINNETFAKESCKIIEVELLLVGEKIGGKKKTKVQG